MSNPSRSQARAPLFAPSARKPDSLALQPLLGRGQAAREPLVSAQPLATTQSLGPAQPLTMERTTSCPASPRACPFGGACHTCPTGIQTQPRISQPGDMFEQEADRVADTVLRMPEPAIQRQGCAACGDKDDDELVQRQAAYAQPASASARVSRGSASPVNGGQALPAEVRSFFEPRFGSRFDAVRLHTGPQADAAARAVDARAYTLGHDIVFAAGEYAPQTEAGRRLLAHELTHVVQQRPDVLQRDGPGSSTGPSVSMPSLTSLLFRYGDLTLRANLPTEVVATLPVELRGVGVLSFSITADIPNNFSLAITLDTQPHLRIRTQVGYNRETGVLSTGLVIQSTRTTCTIPDAAAVQEQLQAAGQRATTALQNFLSPPAATPPATTAPAGGETGPTLPPEISRAVELGSAIGDLYSKAKAAGAGQRCITRPVWSLDFGARIPVNPPQGPDVFGPGERDRGPQPYIGGGFTLHF